MDNNDIELNEEINNMPVFEDISSGNVSKHDDNFLDEYKNNVKSDDDVTTTHHVRLHHRQKEENIKKEKKVYVFNNEEPLAIAIKKVVSEILIIAAFICSLIIICAGIQFTLSKLGNNSIENINMSDLYKETVSVNNLTVTGDGESETADNVVNSVVAWYGKPNTKNTAISPLPSVLKSQLNTLLDTNDVSLKSNIANYTYITSIYTSLQEGNPVIITLSNKTEITYAVVSYIDTENAIIKVTYSDGNTATLNFNEFISATRFKNDVKLSKMQQFLKFIGVYKVNTAFFIK